MKQFTVVFLAMCFAFIPAFAEDCSSEGEYTAFSYLLIDRTDELNNKKSFARTVDVVKSLIQPGERLVIGTSTGSMGSTRVLLDTVLPAKSMWISNMKYRSKKKKFRKCVDAVKAKLLSTSEEHKRSALLETLKFVRDVLTRDKASSKRLFLYSDMVQNSQTLSFYPLNKFNAEQAMKKAVAKGLIWELPEVRVSVGGVGQVGTDKSSLEIEKFWESYFTKAKAELDFIGPVLIK